MMIEVIISHDIFAQIRHIKYLFAYLDLIRYLRYYTQIRIFFIRKKI